MKKRPRLKKTGRPGPVRGVRLRRDKAFQPRLKTADNSLLVRSRNEQQCVVYFTKKRIKFVYEPLLVIEGRQYRPDFYLPKFNIFLEICGYGHMPHYRERVAFKKQLYQKNGLRVLFIEYSGRGSLEKTLAQELQNFSAG
ncbi:MAG: hypothetical protein ACOYVF_07125 [Candidatus Zixiibacteriota bacterium]